MQGPRHGTQTLALLGHHPERRPFFGRQLFEVLGHHNTYKCRGVAFDSRLRPFNMRQYAGKFALIYPGFPVKIGKLTSVKRHPGALGPTPITPSPQTVLNKLKQMIRRQRTEQRGQELAEIEVRSC